MDDDDLLGRLDPNVIAQIREEIREGKLKIGDNTGLPPPPPRSLEPVPTPRSLEEQVVEAVRVNQPTTIELLRSLRRKQNETLPRLAQGYDSLRDELISSLSLDPSQYEAAQARLQLEACRLYEQVSQLIEETTERICEGAPSLGQLLRRPALPHYQHNRQILQLVLINFNVL